MSTYHRGRYYVNMYIHIIGIGIIHVYTYNRLICMLFIFT